MVLKKHLNKVSKPVKSVFLTGVAQFSSSIVNFIAVPILISYLSKDSYGLWVTLTSLIGWIFMSDFGIGYSFRNKVTEYLADKDFIKFQAHFIIVFKYYCVITVIIFFIFVYLLYNSSFLSGNKILALIIYLPYIIYFPFSVSSQILQGLRLVHLNGIINLIRSALWAVGIIYVTSTSNIYKIEYIAICYSCVNCIINGITVYLALKRTGLKIPNLNSVFINLTFDKSIRVGFQFFLLQINTLLLFSMGSYFVYTNLSPELTANYDTLNKLYTLFFSFFNIIISVYWSEIAFYKSDKQYKKLENMYNNLIEVAILFSFFALIFTYIIPSFIPIWTSNQIIVKYRDCLPFTILIILQSFSYVGSVFLNAFEKIFPQVILSIISTICMFPLVKLSFNNDLGISAVPITSSILLLPNIFLCHKITLQYIKEKKYGS